MVHHTVIEIIMWLSVSLDTDNVNAFIGNVAGFEGKGCKHRVIGSQPAAHEGRRVVVYVVDSVSHNFAWVLLCVFEINGY